MNQILDLNLLQARISAVVADLKAVGGALEYGALLQSPPREKLPAAFVVPLRTETGENLRGTGPALQNVTEHFAVMLCVSSQKDAKGAVLRDELRLVRLAIAGALVGFMPAQEDCDWEQVIYRGGRLTQLVKGGVAWWQDNYSTSDLMEGGA